MLGSDIDKFRAFFKPQARTKWKTKERFFAGFGEKRDSRQQHHFSVATIFHRCRWREMRLGHVECAVTLCGACESKEKIWKSIGNVRLVPAGIYSNHFFHIVAAIVRHTSLLRKPISNRLSKHSERSPVLTIAV